MGYSSIIQKKCKCGCGKWPTLGYDGYNMDCRPDLKEEKLNKHKKKQALAGDVTKVRKLALPTMDQKVEDAQMQLYWMLAKKEIAKHPYCMECELQGKRTFIPEFIKMVGQKLKLSGYRIATAHVLPKRKEYGFPSVAANPINRLFLADSCGHHTMYDSSWEKAATMKVWPMAVEIFKKLYPLIPASERKNIPEVFLQEIEP